MILNTITAYAITFITTKTKLRKVTTRQLHKINMYYNIKHLLELHEETFRSIPLFSVVYDEYLSKLSQLENSMDLQTRDTKEVSRNKNNKLHNMIDNTLVMAGILHTFAHHTNNKELIVLTNLSHTRILRLRQNTKAMQCVLILELATKHYAALRDFGITISMIKQLKNSIEAYKKVIVEPYTKIRERKTATLHIKKYIRTIDNLLKTQLDKLSVKLKRTNNELYNLYRKTRTLTTTINPKKQKDLTSKD